MCTECGPEELPGLLATLAGATFGVLLGLTALVLAGRRWLFVDAP